MSDNRVETLRRELAELERQNHEWWRAEIAQSTEGEPAWYQEHKRELHRNSRMRARITRELRSLEWPPEVSTRLWRCLRMAGFETWKDVMVAITLHGVYWFGQFREIGSKQLELLEQIARTKDR